MAARAEKSDDPDDDQIQRDDVIEQARRGENQNAGDERDERPDGKVNVHDGSLVWRVGGMPCDAPQASLGHV